MPIQLLGHCCSCPVVFMQNTKYFYTYCPNRNLTATMIMIRAACLTCFTVTPPPPIFLCHLFLLFCLASKCPALNIWHGSSVSFHFCFFTQAASKKNSLPLAIGNLTSKVQWALRLRFGKPHCNFFFLDAAWEDPGQFAHQSAKRRGKRRYGHHITIAVQIQQKHARCITKATSEQGRDNQRAKGYHVRHRRKKKCSHTASQPGDLGVGCFVCGEWWSLAMKMWMRSAWIGLRSCGLWERCLFDWMNFLHCLWFEWCIFCLMRQMVWHGSINGKWIWIWLMKLCMMHGWRCLPMLDLLARFWRCDTQSQLKMGAEICALVSCHFIVHPWWRRVYRDQHTASDDMHGQGIFNTFRDCWTDLIFADLSTYFACLVSSWWFMRRSTLICFWSDFDIFTLLLDERLMMWLCLHVAWLHGAWHCTLSRPSNAEEFQQVKQTAVTSPALLVGKESSPRWRVFVSFASTADRTCLLVTIGSVTGLLDFRTWS